jgi:hypothetical protein
MLADDIHATRGSGNYARRAPKSLREGVACLMLEDIALTHDRRAKSHCNPSLALCACGN